MDKLLTDPDILKKMNDINKNFCVKTYNSRDWIAKSENSNEDESRF